MLFGSPELAPSGDGRLELFVFDIAGVLWHIWQTAWSNGWSGWDQRSPGGGGAWPAAVAPSGDGRLELFFVGGAGDLQHQWQTAWSNGWSQWVSLGAPPPIAPGLGFYAPGIAPNADGRLMLFVANGALWRLEQTVWSNGWSNWLPNGTPTKGGVLIGPVAAARSGDGRIYAFVVDANGTMWGVYQEQVAGVWSDLTSFGTVRGGLADRPALARSADGRLELFARGNDGALWHRWQEAVGVAAPWSDWVDEGSAGDGFVDHPVVGSSADGRLELFITGADGNIWHIWQTVASNGWSPWVPAGLPPVGFTNAAPGLGRSGDGRLELFAVGRDGNLWHRWQTAASNGWSDWISHGQP
jgi:hypothetical protein